MLGEWAGSSREQASEALETGHAGGATEQRDLRRKGERGCGYGRVEGHGERDGVGRMRVGLVPLLRFGVAVESVRGAFRFSRRTPP
eukprot:5485861-Pleurochrysis_carterae.AAC.1